MPDPQQPQQFDYAKLPDGSYAKFPHGTSPEQMKAKLTSTGLLKQTKQPQQRQPGIGKRYAETMQVPTDKAGLKNALQGASGAGALYQTGKGMYDGIKAAVADVKAGHLMKAAEDVVTPLAPFPMLVGGNIGEDVKNKNYRGLTGTGLGLATQAVLAGTGYVEGQPEALRTRAAELNTKVLKQAAADSRDYKTSAGLQVAQEQIVASARALPEKIERVRAAKDTNVQQMVQAADKAGTVIDVSKEIKSIVQDVAQVANRRGEWTPQLRNQVSNLIQRVTTQTDFKTGQTVPLDLSKLSVSRTLQLEKGLENLSAFGKEAPVQINNLARRIRGVMNDKLPPAIQAERAAQSKLIVARDAARKNWEQILNDKSAAGRGVLYKGAGPVAVYLGLKAIGLGGLSAPFLGTVALYKALASTPSRTLRAALYAKAADLIEGATRANAAPSSPAQPGSAMQGPLGPKPGQPIQNKVLTAQNAPPTAPATFTTNPPAAQPVAPPRGTMLPASATRARAGSGDYVRPTKAETNVAKSNTKAVPEGQSKAMLDRLDTLLERQAKPKSGADRMAIAKEIDEVKRLLRGEQVPGAAKRIADRERLAGKRAEAAATTVPEVVGANAEPIAKGSSPELRTIALDAGYKALLKYEGGAEMSKALKATAKAMQKLDPSYDEVEKLTEALTILKQVSGDLDTAKK